MKQCVNKQSHQTSKEVHAHRARLYDGFKATASVETANVEKFFIIEIGGKVKIRERERCFAYRLSRDKSGLTISLQK